MAECGKSLSDIVNECRLINSSMATIGATVSSCTVPGSGLLFEIGPDEVDIGVGIHGEAGVHRTKVRIIICRRKSSLDPLIIIHLYNLICIDDVSR